MNRRGQYSLIAAMLLAVVLVGTTMITYSVIRNFSIEGQPQVLSAVDEINFALKQILGYTVGQYSSVLKVTANREFAYSEAEKFLVSGLDYVARMHPDWGLSLRLENLTLEIKWFTGKTYSLGKARVSYDLPSLGIFNVAYETSCKLGVEVLNVTVGRDSNTTRLLVTVDERDEPLITLGRENFKFYRYWQANTTWVPNFPNSITAFANGTYVVEVPSGIDPEAFVVEVQDERGLCVIASSYSRYTINLSWESLRTSAENYVDARSDVDGSPDKGTHSNFNALKSKDNVFDTLTEAGFLAKKGTFNKQTGVTTQEITGVGFRPKAVIFWWISQVSTGLYNSIRMGYGFATEYDGSCQNLGVAFASDDNVRTSNAGRRRSEKYSIIILSNGNPTLAAQGKVTKFTADGFVIEWDTTSGNYVIHYIALGGPELVNAKAGTFTLPTSPSLDVTNVGFKPDFLMFLWTFTEQPDSNTANAEIGIGFAVSPTKRGAIVACARDGQSGTDTYRQQRTDSCILLLNPTSGQQDAIADLMDYLPNGFKINIIDSPSSPTPIFYLALKGGNYDVGSFNSPTSTGIQQITTVGFQPVLVMLATQGQVASNSIGSGAEIAFGAATSPTEKGFIWFEDPDNQRPSDNAMEIGADRIIQWRDRTGSNSFALRGSADFVSFLSNGFKLQWSNVESQAKQIIYVAFGGNNYELDLEAQWTIYSQNVTTAELCIYADVSAATEPLMVDVWHNETWVPVILNLVNGWNNVSVIQYLNSSTFTIRFKGSNEVSDSIQDYWRIDALLLRILPTIDLYETMRGETIIIELLQNGTLRWLGENLRIKTQAKPIPPIPIKGIHVFETINGVEREVPFQIEEWASEYRVPLSLANNMSVFSNRHMIVFPVNPNVTKVVIWWDGRDTAKQTPLAYRHNYVITMGSNYRKINNGIVELTVKWPIDKFTAELKKGTTIIATTDFMRVNNDYAYWGYSAPSIPIVGPVRAVLNHEVEWPYGGVENCPNFYAHIVLTLPVNATYYTYQLRYLFLKSQDRPRTISDLCPMSITSSTSLAAYVENGTASNGYPTVGIISGSSSLYNYSASCWQHRWAQINTSQTAGFGIMFTTAYNKMLYYFDGSTAKRGAINVTVPSKLIELRPVCPDRVDVVGPVSGHTQEADLLWYGAVVVFDSASTPIYKRDGELISGLWILVNYPPVATVVVERS